MAARRHHLVAEVRQRLVTRCGFGGETPLIVAVSGGADSLALLIATAMIRDTESGVSELVAAHVNHHLRDEADADEQHVREVCARFDVPLQVEHVYPAQQPGNLAAVSRRLRYEVLQHVAKCCGARHVAVAHHAEDQFETMLMMLSRGAGLDGLSAMPWQRVMDGEGMQLLRPLLGARKQDCVSLCEAAATMWREDQSNVDCSKSRNRLRADVLPVLEELWPDAPRRASATADLLREMNDLLEQRLHSVFGEASNQQWDRETLRELSVPLIAAGLRRAVVCQPGAVVGDELSQRHLLPAAEAIRDDQRRPRDFDLSGGWVLVVRSKTVQLMQRR